MKKQNGFAKILLVIVAIIAVAAFTYIQIGYRTETIPSDITDNETNSSLQSSEKDLTADWKTYRNDKYGFEVKYPERYKINETPYNDIFEFDVTFWNSETKVMDNSDAIPSDITIRYIKTNNMTWEELMYNHFGSDTQIKLLEKNPKEIKDFPVTDPVKFIVEPILFLPSGYAFRKNGYSVLIFVSMDTNEESKINLEKLISTFKFTK